MLKDDSLVLDLGSSQELDETYAAQTTLLKRILECYPYLSAMRLSGPFDLDCSSTDVIYTLDSIFLQIKFYYNTITETWLSDYTFLDEEFAMEYVCEEAGLDALCERLSDVVKDCYASFYKELLSFKLSVMCLSGGGEESVDSSLEDPTSLTEHLDLLDENDNLKAQVSSLESEIYKLRSVVACLQNVVKYS